MIDIQEKLYPHISAHEEILQNSRRLLKAAEVLKVPVLVTEQYPKGLGPTLPALKEMLGSETRFLEKITFSCYPGPGFTDALSAINRPVTVVFGIETHICVLSTVMDLISHGHEVAVVADACGSRKPENHELAIAAARTCGALVLPVETVIYQMLGAAGTEAFKAMLPYFKD